MTEHLTESNLHEFNNHVYSVFGCAVLVVYDTSITFDREMEYIWRSKFNLASYIFIASRYIGILAAIIGILVSIGPVDGILVEDNKHNYHLPVLCNPDMGTFESPLVNFIDPHTACVGLYGSFYGLRWNSSGFKPCIFDTQQLYVIKSTDSKVTSRNMYSLLHFEVTMALQVTETWSGIVVITSTLMRTFGLWRASRKVGIRSPFVGLIIRDGAIYSLVTIFSSVVDMILDCKREHKLNVLGTFGVTIASISVSRAILDLRSLPATSSASDDVGDVDNTTLEFETLESEFSRTSILYRDCLPARKYSEFAKTQIVGRQATIPVDKPGYILINGAPSNASIYPTLVVIDGAFFNGGIFQRVAANAASNNLRVLSIYHRDVLPSTAFTPEELRVFKSNDPRVHEAWLGERLLEYVNLLTYFVEKENIPTYDKGEGTGGLSIMGWSAGNCYTIPLLGSVNTALPENKTKMLEKYIRTFILFDLPYHCIGEPMPLLTDPMSHKYPESFTKLVHWNASYYTHSPKITSCFSSTGVSTEANLDSFPTREKILEEGLLGQVSYLEPTCTSDRIPQEMMSSILQSSGKESEINSSDSPPMTFLLSPDMYRSFSDRAFSTTTTRVSGSTDANEDNGNRP
ncbi:hypothetical protein C8Q75DRAFT_734995 [Abortiporus biennis]|nr:hypothetical protein C8Q75DRAFT_734995 [Abortiporus biennis]